MNQPENTLTDAAPRVVWSRYNLLFHSQRHGWLLFNTVSRAFFEVSEALLPVIRGIMEDPSRFDYTRHAMLYMRLRAMSVLVEEGRDDAFYNVRKMRTLTQLYADTNLSLTIAVTRACNFDCSYCFEGNRTGSPMSREVEDKLIRFIRAHQAKKLNVVWYGGEPLLAFDRLKSIDGSIKETGKPYQAMIVTNGYLLTEEKIACLNDLNIGLIQITLDGGRETHNSRRYLKSGKGTYDVILGNIRALMASDYKGALSIRVNVDTRNEEEFASVYRFFQESYPADFPRRVSVYPGFVRGDDHPQSSCFFDAEERGAFIERMYRAHGIIPLTIFPQPAMQRCTMTHRNSFVVGPDGELYKCWDDVGLKDRVVGTLDVADNWDVAQIAEGMVGCSYLDSEECKSCMYFPICDGGCPRVRQNNLRRDVKTSSCTYFKGNLEKLLEIWYERRLDEAAARGGHGQA